MAEIYKIQTSAQGVMLPSQDRVQLQNDAGRYLQAAAKDMQRIGQLADDRANREATESMKVATEEANAYIADFNAMNSADYQDVMAKNAMKIWDDRFSSMTRNQKVMFERNNPSAREIFSVGVAKAVGEKALNHEVTEQKMYNDQESINIAFDDNMNRRSPSEIKSMLKAKSEERQLLPVFQAHPEKLAELNRDLQIKAVSGALDDAMTYGNFGDMDSILADSELTKYFDAKTVATYKRESARLKKEYYEDLANGKTSEKEVKESTDLFDAYANVVLTNARASGMDQNTALDTIFRVTSQINNGKKLSEVDVGDINILNDLFNMQTEEGNSVKMRLPGVMGKNKNGEFVTFESVFGGMSDTALIKGSSAFSGNLLKSVDGSYRGQVTKIHSSAVNHLNKIQTEQDVKNFSSIDGSKIKEEQYLVLRKIYEDYNKYEQGLNEEQHKTRKTIEYILEQFDNNADIVGGTTYNEEVADTSWFSSTRRLQTGNMTMAEANKAMGFEQGMSAEEIRKAEILDGSIAPAFMDEQNKAMGLLTEWRDEYNRKKYDLWSSNSVVVWDGITPYNNEAELMEKVAKANKNAKEAQEDYKKKPGEYHVEVRKGFDNLVDPFADSLNSDIPDRGTMKYALMAVAATCRHLDEGRDENGQYSEFAKAMGAGGTGVNGRKSRDIYWTLMEEFTKNGGKLSDKIDTNSSVPAKDTTTYNIVKRGFEMAGFKPTPAMIELTTNKLRQTYHGSWLARDKKGLTKSTKNSMMYRY